MQEFMIQILEREEPGGCGQRFFGGWWGDVWAVAGLGARGLSGSPLPRGSGIKAPCPGQASVPPVRSRGSPGVFGFS